MRMSPRLRQLALTVHITLSVGWLGAVAAYTALDVTTVASQDAQMLRAMYVAMEQIARYVIVPLAVASLLTGLVMALGTRWGLFRHYWVVISFGLTVVATAVLLVEVPVISALAEVASDPTTSDDALRALPTTLVHSAGGMAVLLLVQVLNVYKPRGVTPYGLRRQHEQHTAIPR